jgi:uncharacterized membrane protein
LRRLQFGLPFAIGLLAMTGLGNGAAHGQTFQFIICNYSGERIAAATSSPRSAGSSQFIREGWFLVNSGRCSTIGTFYSGYFYYYAESDESPGDWGDGFPICVRYPGPFEYISSGGVTCSTRELKGFHERLMKPDVGTFTWTLR